MAQRKLHTGVPAPPAIHARRYAADVQAPRMQVRRTHSDRREEAEERMLYAAVAIVAERGLEDLTLAACSQVAGYGRGLAAHYFGSKEGLLAAIADHIVEEYTGLLDAGVRGRSGLGGLLDAASFYIDAGRSDPATMRAFHVVLGCAIRQTSVTAAIAKLNRESAAGFAGLIRRGIEQGEIRPDIDPGAQARLVLATLRGVMAQWLLDPKGVDIGAVKRALLANLRHTLERTE